MYSQNHEDDKILEYFGDKKDGFLLDIGALHPTDISNTRGLIERGWSGLLADMSPHSLVDLVDAYRYNPKIMVMGGAIVCEKTSPLKVWLGPKRGNEDYTALSTTEAWHKEKWEQYIGRTGQRHIPYIASTISIDELYAFLPEKVDFVSIDVEGTSFDLAMKFDFNRFSVDAIIVEHDGNNQKIYDKFANDYTVAALIAENILLLRKV